jgi:hypothetical protein
MVVMRCGSYARRAYAVRCKSEEFFRLYGLTAHCRKAVTSVASLRSLCPVRRNLPRRMLSACALPSLLLFGVRPTWTLRQVDGPVLRPDLRVHLAPQCGHVNGGHELDRRARARWRERFAESTICSSASILRSNSSRRTIAFEIVSPMGSRAMSASANFIFIHLPIEKTVEAGFEPAMRDVTGRCLTAWLLHFEAPQAPGGKQVPAASSGWRELNPLPLDPKSRMHPLHLIPRHLTSDHKS